MSCGIPRTPNLNHHPSVAQAFAQVVVRPQCFAEIRLELTERLVETREVFGWVFHRYLNQVSDSFRLTRVACTSGALRARAA